MSTDNPQTPGKPDKPQNGAGMGFWLPIGVAIGTALGAAFHNLAIGVALGAGIGGALGAVTSRRKG